MFTKKGGDGDSDIDRQRLLALVNNLTDAVLALDSNFSVTLANGTALGLLDKNELKGQAIEQIAELIDKTGNIVSLRRMMQDSPTGYNSRDLRLRLHDHNLLNLYINIAPVKMPYGTATTNGYVLILRDITHEKMLEEERDDFINVAGHELRTPVAVAEGGISNAMLLAERTGANETVRQSLKMAHDQVLFLSNLINDLSVLARADRGKLAMTIDKFSVKDLVSELANGFQPQAQKKNLHLDIEIADDIGDLTSSRLYVGEILQNLVTNSIKYTESGGVRLTADSAENGARFTIADTGIGISQADQNMLFTKFFRSADERVKKQHGTGLGLYIIGKLTRLLEANIEVKSELNKGTTFTLVFPNIELPAPPQPSAQAQPSAIPQAATPPQAPSPSPASPAQAASPLANS